MASPDTAPFVYDFKYSYYENYYRNRIQQMGTSGDFYKMWKDAWESQDALQVIDGVLVNNGIDITYYVHKNYNGDTPMCLTDKIIREIDRIINDTVSTIAASLVSFTVYISTAILSAVTKFFKKAIGSFIVTATVNTLEHKCAKEFIEKLKNYRDATMTSREARNMLRYYSVLGPKIVDAIEDDKDKETVYRYIYAEYISKLSGLIDMDEKFEVFSVYFSMIDDMLDRYQIKTSKRFVSWRQQIQY